MQRLIVTWLAVGALLTAGRASLWTSPEGLWLEAHRRAPARMRPVVNLGVLADERGDRRRARAWFELAGRSDDREGRLLGKVNLLLLDYEDGRVAEARRAFSLVLDEYGYFRSYPEVRRRVWPGS